jgi:hypothetical protein
MGSLILLLFGSWDQITKKNICCILLNKMGVAKWDHVYWDQWVNVIQFIPFNKSPNKVEIKFN